MCTSSHDSSLPWPGAPPGIASAVEAGNNLAEEGQEEDSPGAHSLGAGSLPEGEGNLEEGNHCEVEKGAVSYGFRRSGGFMARLRKNDGCD